MSQALELATPSRTAGNVDAVFLLITVITVVFFFITQGLLIYFAVKYRRKRAEGERETPYITGNRLLEIVWILVPSVVVFVIFVYGYAVFREMRTPMSGASEINVTAKQWLWEFQYPDGRKAVNELRVPQGKPVKLVMTSPDVIHGFFLPDFRLKQDVVPGRYTYLWLKPDKPGTYVIFCSQYCGVGHSRMEAKLIVMPQDEYAEWAKGGETKAAARTGSLAERGEELVEHSGCLNCHALSGKEKIGPTFRGIYGRKTPLEGGGTATADENYLRESILDPGAKIVKGYPNVMPTFKGTLSDEDVAAIIAYLKTLK